MADDSSSSSSSFNFSESLGSEIEESFGFTGAEDFEPVATEEEQLEYERQVAEEEEQLTMLKKRFEGDVEVHSWYVRKFPYFRQQFQVFSTWFLLPLQV